MLSPHSSGLAATGGLWLNFWQMFLVSKARKDSGIKYPQMYASKEEQEKSKEALKFNCVQRAHQVSGARWAMGFSEMN